MSHRKHGGGKKKTSYKNDQSQRFVAKSFRSEDNDVGSSGDGCVEDLSDDESSTSHQIRSRLYMWEFGQNDSKRFFIVECRNFQWCNEFDNQRQWK